jgi:hypothetical protein
MVVGIEHGGSIFKQPAYLVVGGIKCGGAAYEPPSREKCEGIGMSGIAVPASRVVETVVDQQPCFQDHAHELGQERRIFLGTEELGGVWSAAEVRGPVDRHHEPCIPPHQVVQDVEMLFEGLLVRASTGHVYPDRAFNIGFRRRP